MSTINVTANIAVAGGPSLAFKRTLTADAYELLDLTVPSGATDLKVELQPGSGVALLAVTADWYGPELSFRAAKTAAATVFDLDQPFLLAGGALAAFGATQPQTLYLSNATAGAKAKDAQVQILVARDATPA